jgi:hypothetical protein
MFFWLKENNFSKENKFYWYTSSVNFLFLSLVSSCFVDLFNSSSVFKDKTACLKEEIWRIKYGLVEYLLQMILFIDF